MPVLQFDGRLESDQDACFIRTVAVYGGKYYLGVRRDVREASGVAAGDQLMVLLEYDADVRTVDLPDPLRSALDADVAAAAAFERLPYTRKKEFVQWVTGAKREETQWRRMEQAMAMLRGRRWR